MSSVAAVAAKFLFTWVVVIFPPPEYEPNIYHAVAALQEDEAACKAAAAVVHATFDEFGTVVTNCTRIEPAVKHKEAPASPGPAVRGANS